MCCPNPSATSITPISSRNASARIFTVGCRSTKSPILPASTSIHAMLRIMAVINTHRSLAIPPAVITESSEKTTSRTRICASTAATADADHQRQRDADPADALALVRRDAPDQDRDEHHVVDAQHDLHRGEREQGN